MPNLLSKVIDYYLDLTNQEPDNYKRHLRPAKQLLELCDGDVEKACKIIEETKKWMDSWGGEEMKIETALRRYPFLKV